MGILKNICLRLALNKEQRLVIWNALQYSDYHYRKNHQTDNAVVTTSVLKAVEKAFGVTGKKYSAGEVNEMLQRMVLQAKQKAEKEVADAYQRGRQEGIAELLDNIQHGKGLVVGDIILVEEGNDAPEEEKQAPKEGDDTAPESTAPEGTETPATEEKSTDEEQQK